MSLIRFILPVLAMGAALDAGASAVKVTMNNVSKTMTFTDKLTGEAVETGAPTGNTYEFEAAPGEYVLTAYATNGTTVNGSMELTVGPEAEEFTVLTCTAYVTNKHEDKTNWTIADGDYTLDVKVNTREGETVRTTYGESTTAGRNTFLALNGNSYYVSFIPSEKHAAEGYGTLFKGGTLTFNVNVNGAIPMTEDYAISVPADADFELNVKFSHFVDFTPVEPKGIEKNGDSKVLTYRLSSGQVYNYRTSMPGKLTQGGYFTMNTDAANRPVLNFTEADYDAMAPGQVNHSVQSNGGYETGDIFVNINERGHLALNPGDTFKAHAMRTWELTDNSTNNYFIEPDFHYTVITPEGEPSTGVIAIHEKAGSAWADIEAVGPGTAIVLVTYDAIGLNFYSGANKSPYMGGEYWGAIWPENTAAYVVTVGQDAAQLTSGMVINEKYNEGNKKLAGAAVDAEHDVFYYLDSEPGALYTFTPEGAEEITMAYPSIGEHSATYTGFGSEGVTRNDDGSVTLLLRQGRQIVRLTDAQGRSAYQVLTAKECTRTIVNATRPGSEIFQPGDKVKIQYSGLRHPANKMAGIYNMSAYVTYNGIPNGTSLILGSGQYTFGSAASAQAVTVDIPADHDAEAEPVILMNEGVIQVNGYGDPIGNHRAIDPVAGRSPNFTAIAHKTYFGMIPDVAIPVTARRDFRIRLLPEVDIDGTKVSLTFNGTELTPDEEGLYSGTYGEYQLTASHPGYRCLHQTFSIGDDADNDEIQQFDYALTEAPGCWDGMTLTEPATTEEGTYLISDGNELAWLASQVNGGLSPVNAELTADIDLGNYDWTPAGTSSKPFSGTLRGNGHRIDYLYVNNDATDYQGLLGYVKDAEVSGLTVDGTVTGKRYVGGVAGYVYQNSTISRCANYAAVSGASTYVGGVAGHLAQATSAVTDCYNAGAVTGSSNCAGVVGAHHKDAAVRNVFNVGTVTGTQAAACVGGTAAKNNVSNVYALTEHEITDGHTLVTPEQMASGEVAYRLGSAFGQTIGTDPHPVLGGEEVKYDEASGTYYNGTLGIDSPEAAATATPAVYYNLQGVASPVPHRGINIVRFSDGSVRKVTL